MNKSIRPSIFKRVLALVIDFIILGILGYLSGFVLEGFYVSLGKYGTLFGTALVIAYFGVGQSAIGKGQTPGKRVVGIKVTDLNSNYLALGKSILRAFILFFPLLNVGLFSTNSSLLIVGVLLLLSIFASVYFVLINKSRRSLHDLLAVSMVTYQDIAEFEISEMNDRTSKKILPAAILAVLLLSFGTYQSFAQTALTQLLSLKEVIERKDGVIAVNGVNYNTTTLSRTGEQNQTYTSVNLQVRIDNEREATNLESGYFDDFYKTIHDELPEAKYVDVISITLNYGYDIGIARKTKSVTKRFE